jgi:hypothetical protein
MSSQGVVPPDYSALGRAVLDYSAAVDVWPGDSPAILPGCLSRDGGPR